MDINQEPVTIVHKVDTGQVNFSGFKLAYIFSMYQRLTTFTIKLMLAIIFVTIVTQNK